MEYTFLNIIYWVSKTYLKHILNNAIFIFKLNLGGVLVFFNTSKGLVWYSSRIQNRNVLFVFIGSSK